jgi:hypothetical protein
MSAAGTRKCPICGQAISEEASVRYRPFCSKRCANIDLGRWLGDAYGIPAEEDDEDDTPEGGEV